MRKLITTEQLLTLISGLGAANCARALRVSESTVSRWMARKSRPPMLQAVYYYLKSEVEK